MTKKIYLLLDCETTGLNPDIHALLSFCCVAFAVKENSKELEIVKEMLDIPAIIPNSGTLTMDIAAMEINKIDIVAHAKKSIRTAEAATMIEKYILELKQKYPSAVIMPAGHNLNSLDIPIMKKILPSWSKEISHRTYDTCSVACALQLAGRIPQSNNLSLAQVCECFGVKVLDHHTAKGDVLMTFELITELTKVLNQSQ